MTQQTLRHRNPFFFVRHGETIGNTNSLCQGHIDFPLTQKGEAQALEAAELLSGLGIARVATSPLGRARMTAQVIAGSLGIEEVGEYPALIERGWGELEGKRNSLMFAQEELERSASWTGKYDYSGIEPKSELLARIVAVMDEVLYGEIPVVIVGHGRFFNALCEVLGIPPVDQIPNGRPVCCEPDIDGVAWTLKSL
jgi:broad specificity phosphatase PhoE